MEKKLFSGNIVDLIAMRIFPGTIEVEKGRIKNIREDRSKKYENFILPGFIDSHIHIESSMLVPSEFAKTVVLHGTVGAICDPHEIGNVLGQDGVRYMITNAQTVPLKFYFAVPSCVPATPFETSGASIETHDLEELFTKKEVVALGEMMNFPGVINNDPEVFKKINLAKQFNKIIDGHAPGLRGDSLKKYIAAGISTDHECFTVEEALEKISHGMFVQLRAGSAARNFEDLLPILKTSYEHCMFCSDDKHPDDLLRGHINNMVKLAIAQGIEPLKVLRAACANPVLHYNLDIGLLQLGNAADFILVDSLEEMNIQQVWLSGKLAAENQLPQFNSGSISLINNFKAFPKKIADFCLAAASDKINVISVTDGQLITKRIVRPAKIENNAVISDPQNDILKIAAINRYAVARPAISFVHNFGLKKGAIASSIAHDSHNIIAVGVTDEDICRAVNLVIQEKGGISCVADREEKILPLPIAGIMSDKPCTVVAEKYQQLDQMVKELGCELHAPYMTLSFMGLLVIPEIKLSDRGLFDGNQFRFIEPFAQE